LIWSIFGTTEEAAEKGIDLLRDFGQVPAGAKARVDFEAFAARLKPCPDTEPSPISAGMSFTAACEVVP
jgi:hypothetical protein